MKHVLLALILILFCGIASAETVPASAVSPSTSATEDAPSFTGTYHCKGHDPYLNTDYSGTVVITPQNTVYSLLMTYDTGITEVDRGTGGMYDKTLLSVVFQNEKDLKKVGLEQYHLSDDLTQISGFWVYLGEDKLGTEVCTRDAKTTAAAKTK
jgi:hypothetical protein